MPRVAALLLTGGASRRMGRDKATLPGPDGRSWAAGLAARLGRVADPVLECGPGRSGRPAVPDTAPGAGPLVATAGGVAALRGRGWSGGALVVATDLPHLDEAALAWLVHHPAPGSVVPVVDGRPQWLCARWAPEALDAAGGLVDAGEERMRALAEVGVCHLAGPEEWSPAAAARVWSDVDTPADLVACLGHGAASLGDGAAPLGHGAASGSGS